jgi:hypothetical protein
MRDEETKWRRDDVEKRRREGVMVNGRWGSDL